jgi:hypothetical protein
MLQSTSIYLVNIMYYRNAELKSPFSLLPASHVVEIFKLINVCSLANYLAFVICYYRPNSVVALQL